MKRSLAVIAVLAMLVSMFSGVVFAEPISCKLDLDQESINYSKSFATARITGRILNANSNALQKVDSTIKVYVDANNNGVLDEAEKATALYTVEATNGTFELVIDTSAHSVANMFVVAEGSGVTFANPVAFRIVKEMEIGSEYTLNYEYPQKGQIVFQATYSNEDGITDDVVKLAYVGTNNTMGTEIASANFKGTDSVGFLFDGSKFTHVGEIGLFVNGVLTLKGEVTAPVLNVEITNSVPHSLGNQEIKFDLDIDESYIDENNEDLIDGYQIVYTIKNSDDEEVQAETILVNNNSSKTFSDVDKQEAKATINFDSYKSGNYTVTVQLKKVTGTQTIVAEADKTLHVVNPSHYTLMGWTLSDTLGNGTIKIQFPDNVDADETEAPNFNSADDVNEQLEVREYLNTSIKHVKLFEVKVTGCGVDETFANFGTHKVDAVGGALVANINPQTTGTLTITIKAYKDADGSSVATFTKNIEITGWNIQISNKSVLVDSEEDIVFTITDENGNPVNNAIIKTGDTVLVDGTTTNIVGGVYTYADDSKNLFDDVAVLPITVTNANDDEKIVKENGISVVGKETYTVSSNKDVLLNGMEETVYVSILDENGDVVYPTIYRIDVDAEGEESAPSTSNMTIGARKDLDNDGVKESIAVTVTPNADQKSMIIRATTDADKKMGQATIEIKKPQVIMTGATKLTENFNREFEFKVVDPRDNSVITEDVTFVENSDYISDDNFVQKESLVSDDGVWKATVRVEFVDWDSAKEDEKSVVAEIKMGEVVLAEVEVAKPSLTATPEKVIMNAPTNVTLTYVDADGNALEGYDVELDGEMIGTTNEDGQVVYATSSTSSLSLKFKAETDVENVKTELVVKSGADAEGPVVTAPEKVDADSAVITITDNVRVSKVMINGKPVDIYFPKAEVTYTANNLTVGDNTFVVEAIDVNNNYTKTTVVIKREAATTPVEFQIGVSTKYGTPVLVGGTTMVPVRFAEDLGATILWNNQTKTATYTLGDKSIAVTIGSKTAVVNGENVQVTETPFLNSQQRTMVPLRMIAQELGFKVHWTSNSQPIRIVK